MAAPYRRSSLGRTDASVVLLSFRHRIEPNELRVLVPANEKRTAFAVLFFVGRLTGIEPVIQAPQARVITVSL